MCYQDSNSFDDGSIKFKTMVGQSKDSKQVKFSSNYATCYVSIYSQVVAKVSQNLIILWLKSNALLATKKNYTLSKR